MTTMQFDLFAPTSSPDSAGLASKKGKNAASTTPPNLAMAAAAPAGIYRAMQDGPVYVVKQKTSGQDATGWRFILRTSVKGEWEAYIDRLKREGWEEG